MEAGVGVQPRRKEITVDAVWRTCFAHRRGSDTFPVTVFRFRLAILERLGGEKSVNSNCLRADATNPSPEGCAFSLFVSNPRMLARTFYLIAFQLGFEQLPFSV